MSFVKYEGLGTSSEVLQKMRDYIQQEGYTIVEDIKDDLDIFDRNITDGKKLVFKDKTDSYFIHLRSGSGYQTFPEMGGGVADPTNSTLPAQISNRFHNVGCTISEGYSPTNRWYDQYLAPRTVGSKQVVGTALKMAGNLPVPPVLPSGAFFSNQKTYTTDVVYYNIHYNTIFPKYKLNAFDLLTSADKNVTYSPLDSFNFNLEFYYDYEKYFSDIFLDTAFNDYTQLIANKKLNDVDEVAIFYDLDCKDKNNNKIFTNPMGIVVKIEKSSTDANFNSFLGQFSLRVSLSDAYVINKQNSPSYQSFVMSLNTDAYSAYVSGLDKVNYTMSLPISNFSSYGSLSANCAKIRFNLPSTYSTASGFIEQNGGKPAGFITNTFNIMFSSNKTTWTKHPQSNHALQSDYVSILNDINSGLFKLGSTYSISPSGSALVYDNPTTLYCNHVTEPFDTLVFTTVDEKNKIYQHLVIGHLKKYTDWTGGIFMSSSHNSYSVSTYEYDENVFNEVLPVLGTTGKGATTFCRINVDEAPLRSGIYWASNGEPSYTPLNCYTGKQLVTPIRYDTGKTGAWTAKIPHYGYLQSNSPTDSGVNANTLNCITINLPLYFAVKVDPDSLDNFAPIGEVNGVYLVSLFNMSSANTYEISYPTSGNLCQVFSMNKRRDIYGFDGISIKQEDNQ